MLKEMSPTKIRKLIPVEKCIRCGYNEFKGSLHVHHMDKNRFNCSVDNFKDKEVIKQWNGTLR